MLKLISFVLILSFGLMVRSQQTPDLEAEGLRGPVHSVQSRSADSITIDGRTSDGRSKQLDSLTFNEIGQIVERVIYDDYGFLVGTEKYSHDKEGQLVAAEMVDDKGRLRERRTYVYRDGKPQEIRTYDEKGRLTLKEVYVYDSNRFVIEESYHDNTRLLGKTTFKTDAKGHVIEAAFFRADGSKAVAPLGPCYSAHRVVYSNNDRGQVIETISYEPSGEVKRKSSYRYDANGNVLAELRKDAYSSLDYRHNYEYDAHGSWIKDTIQVHTTRVPLFNDKPDESDRKIVRTRQITYY